MRRRPNHAEEQWLDRHEKRLERLYFARQYVTLRKKKSRPWKKAR